MTYNLRFDKFKKEIEGEVWGVILVTFSQNSITKVVSTKYKIKRVHFDKYFDKDFKRFNPGTNTIDAKYINSEIERIVNTKNPFEAKSIPILSDGYISFIKKDISYVANLSTRKIYSYAVSTFEEYIQSIELTDIPLNELNLDIFRNYKSFLDGKVSFGTIKYYLTLHRSFVTKAFDDELTQFVLSLKRFKLENNGKKPTVLNDDDITKIRNIPGDHPLYKFVQFAMMQLFSNGIRFSDCLLIKLSDFKDTYLEIHQMKTNRVLQVPFSPMLIDTLDLILNLKYIPTLHPYNRAINTALNNLNADYITEPKKEYVLRYIHNQKDRFLFDFVDPLLLAYKKGSNMTVEQHKRYILHRVNYNNHLIKIRKQLKLSVATLSSHSMRYAYTRIALENEIPLRTLSQSLGHSSVTITEKYIRDNFQVENYKIIGEMMASKYKETPITEKS